MRISKAPQERRAELVAAARTLFDEKGVDKTRVADIVRRVGVAQGVFYYYFASKAEMVEEVARQVGDEVQARVQHILHARNEDFARRMADFIELYIDVVDQFLGDDETSLAPLHSEAAKRTMHAHPGLALLQEALGDLVRQGVQAGAVTAPYPHETARVLLKGLQALAEEQLPPRVLIYSVVEQGLGLQKGTLVAHAKNTVKKTKAEQGEER